MLRSTRTITQTREETRRDEKRREEIVDGFCVAFL
jgi:hypothetical protein